MSGPGLRRTSWTDLAVAFAVVGVLTFAVLSVTYDSLPPLEPLTPVPLVALAAAEAVAARRVAAAVRHDPDARPMAAIVIARCVALGKASSLVAAGVVGAAAALLVRLLPDLGTVRAATDDSVVGGLLLVAGLLLVGAGLWLEKSGVDPGNGTGPERTRT